MIGSTDLPELLLPHPCLLRHELQEVAIEGPGVDRHGDAAPVRMPQDEIQALLGLVKEAALVERPKEVLGNRLWEAGHALAGAATRTAGTTDRAVVSRLGSTGAR